MNISENLQHSEAFSLGCKFAAHGLDRCSIKAETFLTANNLQVKKSSFIGLGIRTPNETRQRYANQTIWDGGLGAAVNISCLSASSSPRERSLAVCIDQQALSEGKVIKIKMTSHWAVLLHYWAQLPPLSYAKLSC